MSVKEEKNDHKKTQLIKLRQLNSAIICLSYFLIWVLLKQGHTVGEVIGNCFLYQTELYLITLLPHSSDSGSYPRNDLSAISACVLSDGPSVHKSIGTSSP